MLRIRNWDAKYETHESRKVHRLEWVKIPNDLIDLGYRQLIDHPDGAAHLGAWLGIVEVASICKPRGTLAENSTCLSSKHLFLKTGLPEVLFQAAIPRLIAIGWLEDVADLPANSPGIASGSPEDPAENRSHITRQERTKDNTTTSCESGEAHAPSIDQPAFDTLEPARISDVPQKTNGADLIREAIKRVAAQIHARHPNEHERRNCSVSSVERKLAAILKLRCIPHGEQEAYLDQIDRNHAAMCASETWQKDGGQFVKALKNWLAPTEEHYNVAPTSAAPAIAPPRLIL